MLGNYKGSKRRTISPQDRKSTRLNSSHTVISYAVFCLKKKTQQESCIGAHLQVDRQQVDVSAARLAGEREAPVGEVQLVRLERPERRTHPGERAVAPET